MLLSIKKHLLPPILITVTLLLTACGGTSWSPGSSGGGSGPISPVTFTLVVPGAYPATSSVSYIYLTITNTSSSNASGLSFSIPAATNTTGTNNITVANGSSNPCYNVSAGKSCTFPVTVAANPNQGSFSVVVSVPNSSASSLSKALGSVKGLVGLKASDTLSLTANIGLVNVPANSQTGANGITFLYNSPVTAAANGSTIVPVTAVVGSNVGGFNTLNLTTAGGALLNFSVLSGNSGSGLSNLAPGSVVSFNLVIPAGVTSYSFYAQTLENGNLIANGQGTNQNTITLNSAATPTGILSAQPQSFSLNSSKTSQILTYTNTGNGPITNLNITAPSPLVAGSTTCSGTLAANSSCNYSVSLPATQSSGGGSIVASYNNGQNQSSATAQVSYTGFGLNITSNNNFTFTSSTGTPSNATQITLQNTGNSNESNIVFTVPNYFSLSAGSSNSCSLSGTSITNTLAPNGSCNLTLTYTNSSVTTTATSSLGVSYTYGSSSQAGTTNIGLTYSTTQSSAALTITPASQSFGNIANNNSESTTYTFTLNNNSSDTAATNVTPTITGANSSLFNQTNTCGSTINAESSCSITVKFGPTSAAAGNESAVLNVAYTPYVSGATVNSTSSLTGTVRLPASANMSASFSGTGFAGGNGESANTEFQIESGATGTLNVTYTNTGTGAANNFTTTASSIGLWTRAAHACSNATVAVGGNCVDTYTINSPTPGASNFNYTNITASYSDESGTVTNQQIIPATASNSMTYVNVYPVATITITTAQLQSSRQAMQGESFNVIATLSGGYSGLNPTVNVTLSPPSSGVLVTQAHVPYKVM